MSSADATLAKGMKGQGSSTLSRLSLAALLAGLAFALTREAPSVHLAATVALCFVMVLAATWERDGRVMALWAALAIGAYVGASFVRHPLELASDAWVDLALAYALVPAALVLLARQAHLMAKGFAQASLTSEIARAKLVRSNTELGRSMAKAEAALGKLGAVVDHLADGLVAIAADGRVELANPALARLLERERIEPGAAVDELLPRRMQALVAACLEDEEVKAEEVPLEAGRIALATVSPIRVKDRLWGTAMLVRDVTLQREIDQMKSDFVATVSHEMRTPLTSLLGFSRLIEKQLEKHIFPHVPEDAAKAVATRETVRGNLQVVLSEGKRLTALINDVLDLSKMESGQMVWDLGPQPVPDIVERAVDATRPLFDASPVALELALDAELPAVRADRNRILQVLINLLSNAAKFTEQGRVTVAATLGEEGVEVSVRDTGPGIRPAHCEVIFEKFKQVGEILTDRPQGTGLGLPICREIVQHHGGRIWVESEVGVGSRFAFVLPLAEA